MNANTKLKQSGDVTFQTVSGEAILIRLDTGNYFSLNKVGTEFWELLNGARTIGEQAEVIAGRYDVDVAMVTRDLLALAEELQKKRLVEEL